MAASLSEARERAEAELCRAFAEDELTVEELEARLDRCFRAASTEELAELCADLSAPPEPEAAGAGTSGAAAVERRAGSTPDRPERDRHDLVLTVMGGVGRRGRWTPARRLHVLACMGGAELDFRDANLPPGETIVHVAAVMGGVEVIVPPEVRVKSRGIPVMGGFDRLDQDGEEGNPSVLRIHGVALMGAVEVRVASPED